MQRGFRSRNRGVEGDSLDTISMGSSLTDWLSEAPLAGSGASLVFALATT